jgi:mannose-6-phosphate isomerase-like protein (cupin superfamily)
VAEDDRESHQPHEMDEVYYAVSGRGMIRVEAEDRAVGPGSIVFVPAGREHHFHTIQDPLTLLVFFAKG